MMTYYTDGDEIKKPLHIVEIDAISVALIISFGGIILIGVFQ